MMDPGLDFRRHLGQRRYELLEDDWLTLLESDPPPSDLLDLVELAARYAPEGTAVTLLRVLADWLAEKGEHRWRLKALRRLLELGEETPELAARFADCYRHFCPDRELVERLLQQAGLGYGAKLGDALAAMDRWVKLLPGTTVLDPETGPAQVQSLDLLLNRVTFEGREGRLVLDVDAAMGRLRPVQPGGFFELLLSDPGRLRARAVSDPGATIRSLLQDLGRPLTPKEIRERFAGIVPGEAWTGVWNRARKELDQDPHVRSVSRPARGYEWSDRPVEHRAARPTAAAREPGLSGEELAGLSRDELVRRYAGLKTVTARRRLIEQVGADRPADAADILAGFFLARSDARSRRLTAERLAGLSPPALADCVRQALTSYRQVPDAFAWVAARCAAGDEPWDRSAGVEPGAVLSRLLDLLESPDYRSLAPALRPALFADGYRLVGASLDSLNPDGARRLLARLDRVPGIESYRHDELAALVSERFPGLRPAAGGEEILTTADGRDRARAELERLTRDELPKTVEELAAARAQGDLSENYEYKAAKEKQARLTAQVERLQAELARARVVGPGDVDTSAVSVGCRVRLAREDGGEAEYTLLGPWDSDPDQGVISYQAPLGGAMLGRRVGESFEFDGGFYTVRSVVPGLEG